MSIKKRTLALFLLTKSILHYMQYTNYGIEGFRNIGIRAG